MTSEIVCPKCWGRGILESGNKCNLCKGTGNYALSEVNEVKEK